MRRPVLPKHVYRLLNHGPTTLVSTAADGKRNVMAAAWAMPLDFEPPLVAVVVAGDTYTRELLERSREMVLNVPVAEQAELTYRCGSVSGRDVDKFQSLAIATEPAAKVAAPLIAGCAAHLECVLRDEPGVRERYDLFVAEVVAAWADDAVFADGRWTAGGGVPPTVHHVSGGVFCVPGRAVLVQK